MNLEAMSQIVFYELYVPEAKHSVPSLFASMEHGVLLAPKMTNVLSSAYLLANLEAMCVKEMKLHIDWDEQVVVGKQLELGHFAPAKAEMPLLVEGHVVGVDDHGVTFSLRVSKDGEAVAEAKLSFGVVNREKFFERTERRATPSPVQACPNRRTIRAYSLFKPMPELILHQI
jgi:fluoroacetyl-CoA thioesterase